VSSSAECRPFQVSSRCTKAASAIAYSTAMHAASVGVNQPKTLPPMMITGVISAGNDTNSALTTSTNVERVYVG